MLLRRATGQPVKSFRKRFVLRDYLQVHYAARMSTAAFQIHEHKVPTTHIREFPRATAESQEEILHLAVKQYTPKESFNAKNEVTIIGAHANGFPKVNMFAKSRRRRADLNIGAIRTSMGRTVYEIKG